MSLEQGIKISNVINTVTRGSTKISKITEYNKNMVLSTIPLDQSKVVLQQSAVGSRLTAITNSQHPSQQQQQLPSGNILTNFTQLNRRSPPKVIAAAGIQNQQSNMSATQPVSSAAAMHSQLQQQNHSMSQSIAGQPNSLNKIVGITPQQQSPSKFVFFQQNGNVHYASNEAFITTNSTQPNNVGNIVIVATEPMDLNSADNLTGPIIHTTNGSIIHTRPNLSSNGDEDLTSLSWLQDKNLIKGIVARNNNSNRIAHTVQSPTGITSGDMSPQTEFIEEAVVHGENNMEVNLESSKQQQPNSNISNNDCSFQKVITSPSTNKSILQHQHLSFSSASRQAQITPQTFISSHLPNNSRTTKNHILSSVTSPFLTTSPAIIHDRMSNNLQNLSATTTLHVGPSGTTTVVEYKNKSNYITTNSRQYSNEIDSSPISNSSQNTIMPAKNHTISNTTFTQHNVVVASNASSNILQSSVESSSSHSVCNNVVTSPSTTHHPHKKYLREQMNGLEQSKSNINNNLSGVSNLPTNNSESHYNNNDMENPNGEHQFSTLFNSGAINYSNNGRITSSVNRTNHNNISASHTEFPTSNPSDFSNTLIPESLTKNSSAQIIYKEYDIDLTKDINEKNNIIPTTNKNTIITSKEQILNPSASVSVSTPKQKHPNNVPYDPKAHANAKPPYSFSSLIFMAIEDSSEKALPVKEIYAWIVQHFPYFKTAPTGWKNSVRHNLSLNKSFLKVEKAPNMGKGSLWRVEQHQRPNLIQALTRSPFYPCPAVDKLSTHRNLSSEKEVSGTESYNLNSLESPPITAVKSNLDARLFPKLSKLMKEMGNVRNDTNSPFPENLVENDSLEQSECQSDLSSYSHNVSSNNSSVDGFFPQNGNSTPNYENIQKLARDCGADSIDDVNAATAMLALKHGSKIFNDNFKNGTPVITNSPSADHTYSAGNSSSPNTISNGNCNNTMSFDVGIKNGSDNVSTCASSDAAYESSDESHNLTPDELEHQRRVEGVDALLSLSSVCSSSTTSVANITNLKRPATEYIQERSPYLENIPHINGKGALTINSLDEGYSTQGNYSQMTALSTLTPVSLESVNVHTSPCPSLPKKIKSSRLRAKIKQIKRKTASLR